MPQGDVSLLSALLSSREPHSEFIKDLIIIYEGLAVKFGSASPAWLATVA